MSGASPRPARRTRYIAGVAVGVAVLYAAFVLVNTQVVGPTTPVPLPGVADWLYLQDALDVVAALLLIAGGAVVQDRLLARDQAIQTATLAGMARVTQAAQRIAETADFQERVPETSVEGLAAPPAVSELADTFNDMIARIEASFEAQRRLLADTSHELRNPLTVLRTNLSFLLREDADPQVRLEAAQEADEEAARLGRLVDDLLLLGRSEAGETLQRRPVRLDELVQAVAEDAREAGSSHRVELLAVEPVAVSGDPERLRQVLRNVVGNALRHTPAGTRVRLSLVKREGVAELVVADDGPGVAQEQVRRLGERFYRADAARSRATGGGGGSSGAGLGLAIAKQLVEAHGGSVAFESAPGRGMTVSIRLPA